MMQTLFVWTIVLALAAPASAESSRVLGVGGHVGYSWPSDADGGTAIFGGDLSIRPFPVVGALVEVGYKKDDFEVRDPTGTIRGAELEQIPILASLQIFPLGQELAPIAPFAIGGIGWYVTRAEIRGQVGELEGGFVDHDVSTGWHLGFGSDLNLGDHLTLTGDFRYVFSNIDLDEVDEVDADGARLTAGLKFFFF